MPTASPTFEDLVRSAVHEDLTAIVYQALAEQREILAPITSSAEMLRERAALSIKETAEVLGVSESTVRSWLAAGELVPLDVSGGRILVGTDQILEVMERARSRRRNCGEAPR